MDTMNDIYLNYHAMTGEITEGLSHMAKLCDQLEMAEHSASLREGKKKLQSHKFAVGILGEFKRGKSTVINALLGKEIMPADILPCSATMNRVSYDLQPGVQLNMMDGTTNRIAVEELAQYVTKLDDDSTANAALIEEAIVFYPCQFCQNGVDIIDTPGLNDDERMNKITEETVPKLDAVIMVLVPDNPFSMSEANFVRNKLMCSDIGRLIFLVNKIDTVRSIDRARVVESIRTKIEKSVLEKTAEVYGRDSEQYQAVKQKMADIRIYPVSAQNALDGLIGVEDDASENEKMVRKSGMPEFESALSKMLTEERGFLELGTPLGSILHAANDAKEKIQTYLKAMDVDNETFMKAQRELLQKQQTIREEKAEEKERLKIRAKEVKSSLLNKTAPMYHELESAAEDIIDGLQLDNPKAEFDNTVKQAMIDRTMTQINTMISDKMAVFCERIGDEIDNIVGKEAIKVTEFLSNAQSQMSCVLSNLGGNSTGGMMVDFGGALAAMFLTGGFGWGGVVSGFRSAGIKGALIGGASGMAASIAVGTVLGMLSLPALPIALIAGAIGTIAGKGVCDKIFSGSRNLKELEKMKKMLMESVRQNFVQMRSAREIETWIENTVASQFDALCSAMDKECEAVMKDADDTIGKIKLDLARNVAEKEAAKKNYQAISESIDELIFNLEPIRQKLLQYS